VPSPLRTRQVSLPPGGMFSALAPALSFWGAQTWYCHDAVLHEHIQLELVGGHVRLQRTHRSIFSRKMQRRMYGAFFP